MIKFIKPWLVTLAFAIAILFLGVTRAEARLITAYGERITENFNTLGTGGSNNISVPADWSFVETGANANITYGASNGASSTGDTYSYGATGSSERAFGALASGNLETKLGAKFTNATGKVISSLLVDYVGEQWRVGSGNLATFDFQYSTDQTALISDPKNSAKWVDFNTLDFTSPKTSPINSALNGNDPANQVHLIVSIGGINIASGADFRIRFFNTDGPGADPGLAVDDFTVEAVPEPATAVLLGCGLPLFLAFRLRRRSRLA